MSLPDIAIATAPARGAGLRAYAVIFAVGLAGAMGWVELPGHLDLLQHPVVLAASGFFTFLALFLAGALLLARLLWRRGAALLR